VRLISVQASVGGVNLEPGRPVSGSAAVMMPVSSVGMTLAGASLTPAAALSNSPLTTAKAGTTSSVQSEPKVHLTSLCKTHNG